MARHVPRRIRASAALVLAAACAPVSACDPSTGHSAQPAHSAHSAGAPGRPAAAPASSGGTGTAAGGSTGGAPAGGTSYVLNAPQVAAGYPQGRPPASLVRTVDGDLHRTARKLGVSGTPVQASYDDRADGAWIFYNGVNGTGFDPGHLHDLLDAVPAVHVDGAGDRITTSAVDADPGPHGGRAVCDTVLVQNAMLTTAATTCSWFTPTTAAGISLVIKGDGTNTKVGFTAADVAPIMRAVRSAVEHPGS